MGIVTIVWFGMMFSDGNKKNNWLAETLESWLNQTAATYSSGTASGYWSGERYPSICGSINGPEIDPVLSRLN